MVKPVAPAPAILIPGLLSDAHVWCEVQPAFDGDVHIPDLRTAGSIQAMVDRALSCSQASEIVLIGHSMGSAGRDGSGPASAAKGQKTRADQHGKPPFGAE